MSDAFRSQLEASEEKVRRADEQIATLEEQVTKLETHFGVTRGQLSHVDDTFLFGDRLPPTTPVSGLYTCGRGCGPT